MTSTDSLGLNEHAIFKNVRETLPKNINKTQNIMCVKDDVLYTWDFQDNCILTLNVKYARNEDAQGVIHQTLLPQTPPLFTPHTLIVNESNTLLAAVGSKGVLAVELPDRCAPYGAFANNKELIYCRSFSLHERILAFSNNLEVRQVKFHPGSPKDCHILILTSDNLLRLYKFENGVDISVGVYPVGVQPMGRFPTTKTTFLEALGEIAIDFDFVPPELVSKPVEKKISKTTPEKEALKKFKELNLTSNKTVSGSTSNKIKPKKVSFIDEVRSSGSSSKNLFSTSLDWPILILYGNGDIFLVTIELKSKTPINIKGPLPILPDNDGNYGKDSCSILCLHTTPPIVCVANCKGTINHAVLLPLEDNYVVAPEENRLNFVENPDRALFVFECVELELGLATTAMDVEYSCPILLHKNLGKLGHYFASHETGVHSVNISCVENLHKFVANQNDDVPDADLFDQPSAIEYLICTKVASSEKLNPVIGFSVYYDPPSILALLANGQLVTLTLAMLFTIPTLDALQPEDLEVMNSPLKKMLSEPFDLIIQKILKQSTTQPILKLSSGTEHTQQECYELLQRAAQVFREEHFKNHSRAREEIEKRVKTLMKLKEIQKKDVERLNREKQAIQEKAENLAEKYEDIKDKQEEMSKKCEKLLILIAKKKSEPSNAEREFVKELKDGENKIEKYKKAIAKMKNVIKYQELQMKNWHMQNEKENILGQVQVDGIKSNLQDMTQKITGMINEVNEYKKQLNLK